MTPIRCRIFGHDTIRSIVCDHEGQGSATVCRRRRCDYRQWSEGSPRFIVEWSAVESVIARRADTPGG